MSEKTIKLEDPQNARNLAERLAAVPGRFTDLAGLLEEYRELGVKMSTRVGGNIKALEDQGQIKAFESQVNNVKSQVTDVMAPRLTEWGTYTKKYIDDAVSATEEGKKKL
ncbi:hypothetical protein [Gordonia sihwensis]|uniref:hypothetical protein n=1 Tax=Gordonia sihwensis TaxID=173559 RepID=UPI003D96B622